MNLNEERKASHAAIVVPIVLEVHPNADSLSVVNVDGQTVCVRTESWAGIEYGVFVPPQNIVDVRKPEFSFLRKEEDDTFVVVKPCKMRGVRSEGILIPAPEGVNVGDDLTDYYGIQHYEPEVTVMGDEDGNSHLLKNVSKYDIDSYAKFYQYFYPNEYVYVSEKIHGSNARFYFDGEKFHVGSRNTWKKNSENCVFWKGFHSHPSIRKFCVENPKTMLYGEVYNNGQAAGGVKFIYDGGVSKNIKFRAFDIHHDSKFYDVPQFLETVWKYSIPTVPFVGFPKFNLDKMKEMAEGQSLIGDHIREGIVVKPLVERLTPKFSRLVCKFVSNDYNNL